MSPHFVPPFRRIALAWLLFLAMRPLAALELAEARWGFDGTMRPGKLNLVSARFFNADAQAFDGIIRFQRSGFTGHQGAVQEARVYVSPQTYRWVHFLVEPSGPHESYDLEFPETARVTGKKTFDSLVLGDAAMVFLLNPRDTSATPPRIPGFPAEAFPPLHSALESLAQVVLDHQPDWDEPRAQALLDWVHLGGVVHVLQTREGLRPEFTGALARLNGTATSDRIGSGAVVRHALSRSEATPIALDAAGFAPFLATRETPEHPQPWGLLSTEVLQMLRQAILPRHPWGWINLILVVYIALIGPGHYFLVKRKNLDYRLALLVLAGLVGVFSVIFYQIGLRGYQNPSMVLSLTRAEVLPGNRVSFTQWAQAFTRKGRRAEITHAPASGVYDLPGVSEKIPAVIHNGAKAVLAASMPINSTLPFVYHGLGKLELPVVERDPEQVDRFLLRGPLPAPLLAGYTWEEGRPEVRNLTLDTSRSTLQIGAETKDVLRLLNHTHSHWRRTPDEDLQAYLTGAEFRQEVLPLWLSPFWKEWLLPEPAREDMILRPAIWRNGTRHVLLVTSALPFSAVTENPAPAHLGITLLHVRLPPPALSTTP